MSNITIISAYYYPEDTAVGLYNTQMVKAIEAHGHNVSVITSFPYYPQWEIRDEYQKKKMFYKEAIGKTEVYRYKQYVPKSPNFFKRILLLSDFTLGSFFNVFKIKNCDLVISVVPHSSTMLLGWILKKRKNAKLWHHVQDFEFDAAHQAGISTQKSIFSNVFYKLLFKIESYLLNKSDLNSTISYTMLSKLKSKSKIETYFFPNWIDANKINPGKSKTHHYLASHKFKILYSGNIGDKQDWALFIEFAKQLNTTKVEIIVVGDGAKKEWLIENIKKLSIVKYYAPVNYEELNDLLCSADLHILFQKDDVVDSVMPSKLLGMMASETPSLITGGEQSEVKKILDESGGGYYIINRNLESCLDVVNELMKSETFSKSIGVKARKFITNKFTKNIILPDFIHKMEELIN